MPRCSYLPMVYIQLINIILELKVEVKLRKKLNTTHNMNSSFISTTQSVHIWHNDCLWGVDYNVCFLSPLCHWCQKTRSNILTIRLWLVTRAPPSLFDQLCSYLAQLLLMVCKLQSKLHITAMALESKVN